MKKKAINLPLVPSSLKRVIFAFLFFSAWSLPNAYSGNGSENSGKVDEQILQDNKIAVQGTVVDATGEPLIGVSVSVKGSSTGTVTDIDGNFKLSVPNANSSLVFSYLGYSTQETVVGAKTSFNITMKDDSKVLDQVVVTALGLKRQEKALGYAMTELKSDELDANVANPIAALQGKAAGVNVSGSDGGIFGSSKIQIRGASTLSGGNQPIYVIDGVILENKVHDNEVDWDSNSNDWGNELKNLNPNDFESVSILKGAAATALYGSRGLYGAIVITTKGGGKYKGFGVSVSQSFGFDKVNTLPDFQTQYGQGEIAGAVEYGEKNSDGTWKKWDTNQFYTQKNDDGTSYESLKYNQGTYWGPKYDGRKIELYDGTFGSYSPNKNFFKNMFKTGFNSNTNVVVKGGNDKTTFYNSFGYKYAEGIVENNSFWRLSNMLKASHKISDRVKINGSVTFAISKPKNPQLSVGDEVITNGVGPLYNSDYYKKKYRGDDHTGMASSSYGDKYAYVPLKGTWWDVYETRTTQTETLVRPTLDVDVKIADWVNFKAEGNMNYFFSKREKKALGTGYMNDGGEYLLREEENKQETLAGSFTFNKTFGEWGVGGFVRGEFYNQRSTYMQNRTDGGLVIPGAYFLDNSKNPIAVDSKISDRKRILSAIFAVNLSWKDQVYLDITGRNDWSSSLVYKDGSGNYSFFYPSVSGSWLISETFKEDLPSWISFLKVRGSWAQVGNDTKPYFIQEGYPVTAYPQGSGGSIHSQIVPPQLYSKSIKPERKNAWEVGLDWRFFNDRIGIDATYYRENTKDQIIFIARPVESGVSEQLINAGNIQNKGIELALHTIPFKNRDWEVSLDFTYAHNDNKIVSLAPGVPDYITLAGSVNYYNYRIGSVAEVGGSYGTLMTDSKPKTDDKGNKILRWNDTYRSAFYERSGKVEKIGSINPKFTGSVAPGIKFKNFRLNALFDFRYGGLMASYSNRYGTAYGLTQTSLRYRDQAHGGETWTSHYSDSKNQEFHDGVIPEGVFAKGTEITTPSGEKVQVGGMSFAEAMDKGYVEPVHASDWTFWNNQWGTGTVNDDWVHEVKYIAFRELSLGYTVPKSFANKFGAQGLNLLFSARNLGYLYNSMPNNLNPESVRGNSAAEFRERGFVPNTASYTFTIGLDF